MSQEFDKSPRPEPVEHHENGFEWLLKYSNTKKGCGRELALVSSFLIHLVLGWVYSWGALWPYITSFLLINNPDYSLTSNFNYFFFFLFCGVCLGHYYAEKVTNKIGLSKTHLVNLLGLSICIFLSSIFTYVWLFWIFYSILSGIFIGLELPIPLFTILQHYPKEHYQIKSYYYLVFGIGYTVFGLVGYAILNPNHVNPIHFKLDENNDIIDREYSVEMGLKLPETLRVLSYIVFGICIFSSIFLKPYLNFVEKDHQMLRERRRRLLSKSRESSVGGMSAFSDDIKDCESI